MKGADAEINTKYIYMQCMQENEGIENEDMLLICLNDSVNIEIILFCNLIVES